MNTDTDTVQADDIQAPMLNLNGTPASHLQEGYAKAGSALSTALAALCEAGPHGRDYLGPNGAKALRIATAQHEARCAAVRKAWLELVKLSELVDEQTAQRNSR